MIGDLQVSRVFDQDGDFVSRTDGDVLHAGIPRSDRAVEICVAYRFAIHDQFDGLLSTGSTFLFPDHCGNLFPCHPGTSEGMTFSLSLSGVRDGETAVYANEVTNPAPVHMLAWASGEFERWEAGTTNNGTRVSVWATAADMPDTQIGAARLSEAFEWFETTLGPYPFGGDVGSVVVEWVPSDEFCGFEHHPYWHVNRVCRGSYVTHFHEAAHGWFGTGVRPACWEDFVLSEGVTDYLTARAIGFVDGAAAEASLWNYRRTQLDEAILAGADMIAWPSGCNEVDVRTPNPVLYEKGSLFLHVVAQHVGFDVLDGALGTFFMGAVGRAASVAELLEHIQTSTGYDPWPCAQQWLQMLDVPSSGECVYE